MKKSKKLYKPSYVVKDASFDHSFRSVSIMARTWPEAIGILNNMLCGFYAHFVIAYKHFKVTF